MKLNELRDIISSTISKALTEAERIRRVRDDEYPKWQINVDDEEYAKLKDDDKRFKETFKLDRDSIDPFKTIHKNANKDVNDYQAQLTKNIQDRAIKNGEKTFVPSEELHVTDRVKKLLEKNGLELEVKGKTFPFGNKKLPPSTMIVNLTSAFDCPAAERCPFHVEKTGDGEGGCYAGNIEKQYKDTELRNLRNEYTFEKLTIRELLTLLDKYIMGAPQRIKRIRISESGDFKSQEVVDFCDKLAGHLYAKYGITTTCYTRQPFDFTNCKNLIVNSSLTGNYIKGAERNYLVKHSEAAFNRVPEGLHIDKEKGTATFKCHCDCYKCNFCYNRKEENGEDPNIRTNVWVKKH